MGFSWWAEALKHRLGNWYNQVQASDREIERRARDEDEVAMEAEEDIYEGEGEYHCDGCDPEAQGAPLAGWRWTKTGADYDLCGPTAPAAPRTALLWSGSACLRYRFWLRT